VKLFGRLNDNIHAQSARLHSRVVLESAMAAAALVATADGEVTFAKRAIRDKVLASLDAFKSFEVHVAVDLFEGFAAEIRTQGEIGKDRALRCVSEAAGDREAAELVMRIARAIGQAGDGFSVREVTRITEVSAALGLASPDFHDDDLAVAKRRGKTPHVIVLGNEKGGTGKSTTALHLAVALLARGLKVGTLDFDGRQATFSTFLKNRADHVAADERDLAMPLHRRIERSALRDRGRAEAEDRARVREAFAQLAGCNTVIIDTPGSESYLSRIAHFNADTLITPLNDSFLDINALAKIDRRRRRALAPSAYTKLVWELNERRRAAGEKAIDWIVMRNRLAHIDARNNREITTLLTQLAERIGFRLEPGFSERVAYRAHFDRGLTLLDLPDHGPEAWNNRSHARARGEIQDLLKAVSLPQDRGTASNHAPRAVAQR
jgi:chromosome partitioning protein